MLAITTKSPYAVSALIELTKCGASVPVPIGTLAERRGIPVQFLESLFASLRRAGVLRSQRGVRGGYSFERSPTEITVLQIVELLEGDLSAEAAKMGDIWDEAAQSLRGVLGGVTIADLAEREARDSGALMYHI